jgi:hypothetical protein
MATGPESTFAAGDRVVLVVHETGERECGVIVHTWKAEELGGLEDCYIAFFGKEFPEPGCEPAEKPYVLRYAAVSLRRAP